MGYTGLNNTSFIPYRSDKLVEETGVTGENPLICHISLANLNETSQVEYTSSFAGIRNPIYDPHTISPLKDIDAKN